MTIRATKPLLASALILAGLAACAPVDRAATTNTSGLFPAQSDGTPVNPSGTVATRAVDRAAGTNVSGAYPAQSDGTPANPPGTAATRAYDGVAGTNVSGANPQRAGSAANRARANRGY